MTRPRASRKPSKTSRIVGYRFGGDIVDYDRAMELLQRAQGRGVVTQFDGNKSMERGKDIVWFNGRPGRPLRALRAQIAALVR